MESIWNTLFWVIPNFLEPDTKSSFEYAVTFPLTLVVESSRLDVLFKTVEGIIRMASSEDFWFTKCESTCLLWDFYSGGIETLSAAV
jgi:hypothetical protein